MKLLCSIFLILISFLIVSAQEDFKAIKQVGPAFPPAARAVRAHGEVLIEVRIGNDGRVVEAKAYLGHPLLKGASEAAAKQWLFSPNEVESDVRVKILSFRFFQGGEIRHIPESEKEEEVSTTHVFPYTLGTETRWESIVPRLLLLERQNGIIKPQKCPLHKTEMAVEIQNRKCDDSEQDSFVRNERYNAAEDEFFPEANVIEMRMCSELGIERAEVHFCAACRTNRTTWLANEK